MKPIFYRFFMPKPKGTVLHVMIPARDIDHAYEVFILNNWVPRIHTEEVGVWHGSRLVAKVVPVANIYIGGLEPFFQMLGP